MSTLLEYEVFAILLIVTIGVIFALYVCIRLWMRKAKSIKKEAKEERPQSSTQFGEKMKELKRAREISLPEPLTERFRPKNLEEIVGQQIGIELLRTVICSKNPMHVIIYGPPGVGKTTAARLLYGEAKRESGVFKGKFVEVDGTIQHYDERSIADSLIGSVHDPIYAGASQSLATNSIPEPKPGSVTEAHGGILFIDEVGELSSQHMNKLLKVLEDGKVILTSAYYDPSNRNIPEYIREVFENGLPADFRLIGATTRHPNEIPDALRSRCVEIFFRQLTLDEMHQVATQTCQKALDRKYVTDQMIQTVLKEAKNPREIVKTVQMITTYIETYRRPPSTEKIVAFKGKSATIGF